MINHPVAALIRSVLGVAGQSDSGLALSKPTAPVAVATLDAVGKCDPNLLVALDDVGIVVGAADYADANIRLRVAATIHQWCEVEDLEEGETLADRICMMLVGIADSDQDGELDEAETTVLTSALEYAWDYLSGKGVTDEDCSLLLNDWDADAAMRISDVVSSSLPDDEDESDGDIDGFAFGDEAQEPALDAVYKKTMAIRHGKKVRINKRVSGHVRLSAAQKVGIRKAQLKSHSARAVMRRMKSRTIGRKMGL